MTEAVAAANPAANPATVFAALGDPTRLSLLSRLSDGHARSIAALSADTTLTRQAVTKHLHVLQDAGLVACVRVGRESRFAFQPEPVAAARGYLDAVSAQWDDALSRLRAFVEG
ncbi:MULTISPECIES: ArsR/SmtB family transcription factor [Nitrospirillum]|uniref:ArsR family transcriptional regulator n=1 Tax=Nitrospirillum amazonense TaxID=28077 RepID=A0A560G4Z2_9PROT|nr:helix-turn-helix transcriptional regulator [Nitrospirillum amazonense]MEC4591386.1 helix-turn-helix transcriptional regulator [Nitrospirillum amazonense]TWB28953.1 ArsR family transcriptional regulator [Nitrospirillum amazonense]